MRPIGIKVSELIEMLQHLLEKHGDCEVISGGGDYPEGVRRAKFQTRNDDPYVPQGTIYIT